MIKLTNKIQKYAINVFGTVLFIFPFVFGGLAVWNENLKWEAEKLELSCQYQRSQVQDSLDTLRFDRNLLEIETLKSELLAMRMRDLDGTIDDVEVLEEYNELRENVDERIGQLEVAITSNEELMIGDIPLVGTRIEELCQEAQEIRLSTHWIAGLTSIVLAIAMFIAGLVVGVIQPRLKN